MFVCGDGSVLEVHHPQVAAQPGDPPLKSRLASPQVKKLTMPRRKAVDAISFWNGLQGRDVRWLTEDEAAVLTSTSEATASPS